MTIRRNFKIGMEFYYTNTVYSQYNDNQYNKTSVSENVHPASSYQQYRLLS